MENGIPETQPAMGRILTPPTMTPLNTPSYKRTIHLAKEVTGTADSIKSIPLGGRRSDTAMTIFTGSFSSGAVASRPPSSHVQTSGAPSHTQALESDSASTSGSSSSDENSREDAVMIPTLFTDDTEASSL